MLVPKTYLWLMPIFVLLLLAPLNVHAAKKRVKSASHVTSAGVSYSSAKLSRGTNSLILTLMNLGSVSKISYELSYTANGIAQGVAGSINPSGTSDSRDLYFGTCSKGVCTPHYNITSAQLVVRTYLKSGGSYTKLYRIKI
jgi:hypothetical protein